MERPDSSVQLRVPLRFDHRDRAPLRHDTAVAGRVAKAGYVRGDGGAGWPLPAAAHEPDERQRRGGGVDLPVAS